MSVANPFYLVVLRRTNGPDVASPPHDTSGSEDALFSELSRKSDVRSAYLDGSIDQFEVYPVGLGRQKSPDVYTQEDVIRNRDRWFEPEGSSESPPEVNT